jgi:hypothetical protein
MVMFARVTELVGGDGELTREQLHYFEADILPSVEALPGMRGGTLLVDRAAGKVLAMIVYDDEQTLADSRETADALRELVFQRMNLCVAPKVHEYEVVLARATTAEELVSSR